MEKQEKQEAKKKEIKELTDEQKAKKKNNIFYKAKKNLSEVETHASSIN
jgi:hypothetical protein